MTSTSAAASSGSTLREAGIVSTRLDGTSRPSRLRDEELERRFPGLLASIVGATPPRPAG